MAEPTRPLGEGAAQEAPTAPHATPRTRSGRRTGPERFWSRWPMRIALGACLLISGAAHCAVVPLEVPRGFEVKDVEGEADIPVDVLDSDDTPPPPPAPPETRTKDEETAEKAAAAALLGRDGGAPRDAGVDAPPDAPTDAPVDASADAPTDAPADGAGDLDGAVAALLDAGSSGPKDPQAVLGAAGSVQAGDVLVLVIVNARVIRTNAVGAKMGYLLRGIPQWDDFMSGTELDPVRDTDWVMISGPSLANSTRDVILIHYSAKDAAVDKAIDVVSKARGGRIDAGVPGVRASLTHADGAARVILRPQPQVLAVVPTDVAEKMARKLVASRIPADIRPGEALYLRVANPHHPMPEIPESITELRLRVVPRPDQGADVFVDGDTKDAATASLASGDVRGILERHNDWITSSVTHGLLDHVEVSPEGSVVRVHLTASRDQIETLVSLVGDWFGVRPGGATSPGAPPAPRGSR